ncbi:Peptidase inhibitor I78 family protein [Roseovarius tolerans]|uniref:Peptidase inhibitor I78 family protein n=1 Tax=Roseovarius tolerans TaxID=74031 RepID=A0A1H8GIF1_9RHOB|nr:I78 family peptidase inhibitor [Roseovarius tolerans]SEN43088.1 Peptidase inhibitor I78 family protein [Roseovarius tolerans]
MRHDVVFMVATIALAACRPAESPPPDRAENCGAEALQHLVGQPRSALDTEAITASTRILPPGAMRTMDHRPDRLNVDLDGTGTIQRLWCG